MSSHLGPHPQYPKFVRAGIPKLGVLKDTWTRVKIGSLFEVVSRPVNMNDEEEYVLVTVKRARGGVVERGKLKGKEISVKSQYYLKEGDFLISKRQISHGACGFVPADLDGAIVSNEYSVLRCKESLRPGFLKNLMYTPYFQQTCFHSSIGVHVEKLIFKLDEWFGWDVDLPNLDFQKTYEDFTSDVDKKISLLKQKQEQLVQYKKGIMQQLFSQQLRFKDDNGQDFPDWKVKHLSELADKVTKKNADNSVNSVLTNSAKHGIVNQLDYFDKDIANENNLTNYGVVEKDDFVYNPRISVHAPVGPIKRNHIGKGVMSPLYTVFRFKNTDLLDFLEIFFRTTFWHRYMNSIANFGARHDRMNITSGDFLALPIKVPCEEERIKVVDFVKSIDQKINLAQQQIEQTQAYKQGLLQQMFV